MKTDEVAEAHLRAYLLGRTSEVDDQAVELQILSDAEFAEFMLVLEDELIDDYLAGRLSETEVLQFETRFLGGNPDLKLKVALARELRRRGAQVESAFPRLWKLSAAAVVLTTVFGWITVSFWNDDVARIHLASGSSRAGGALPRLDIPEDVGAIELAFELESDDYPSYEAALRDADGRELFTQDGLDAREQGGRFFVPLRISREQLPAGDYVGTVSGITEEGRREPVASYAFRLSLR